MNFTFPINRFWSNLAASMNSITPLSNNILAGKSTFNWVLPGAWEKTNSFKSTPEPFIRKIWDEGTRLKPLIIPTSSGFWRIKEKDLLLNAMRIKVLINFCKIPFLPFVKLYPNPLIAFTTWCCPDSLAATEPNNAAFKVTWWIILGLYFL